MSLFTSFDPFEEIDPDTIHTHERVVLRPRVVVSTAHVGLIRTGRDAEVCMMRLQNSQVAQPSTAYLDYGTGYTVWDHGGGCILSPPPEVIEAPQQRFYRGHYSPPSPVPFFDGHPHQDEDARDVIGAAWMRRVAAGGDTGGVKSIFPVNEVHDVAPDYQTSFTCEMEVHCVVSSVGSTQGLQRPRSADATLVETATFANLPYMLVRNLMHPTRKELTTKDEKPSTLDARRVHVSLATASSGSGRWAVFSPSLLIAASIRREVAGQAPTPEYTHTSGLSYADFKPIDDAPTSPTKSRSPTRKSPSVSGRSNLKYNPSIPQPACIKSHPFVDDVTTERVDLLARKSATQFITMLSLGEGATKTGGTSPRSTSPTKRGSYANNAATALSIYCSQKGMMPLDSVVMQIYNRTPMTHYHRLSPSGMLLSPMQLDSVSATKLVHQCAESLVDYFRYVEDAPVDQVPASKLIRRLLTATVNIPEHIDDRDKTVVRYFNQLTGRALTPSPVHGGRLAVRPLDLGVPSIRAHRSSATFVDSFTAESKYVPNDVGLLTELIKDSGPTMPSTNPRPIVSYLEVHREQLYNDVETNVLVGNIARKVLSLISECQMQQKHPVNVLSSHLAQLSKRGLSLSLPLVVRALMADTIPQYVACIEHPLHFLYPHMDELMGPAALLGNIKGGSIADRPVPSKKKAYPSKQTKNTKKKDVRSLQNQFHGSGVVWEPSTSPPDPQDILQHTIWLQETYLPASDDIDKSGVSTPPPIISSIAQGVLREACFIFFPYLYHSPVQEGTPLSILCPTTDVACAKVLPYSCLDSVLRTVRYSLQCARGTLTDNPTTCQKGNRHPLIRHLLSLTVGKPNIIADIQLRRRASVSKSPMRSKKRPVSGSGKLPILVENLPSYPPKPPAPQFILGDLPSPFDSFYEDAAGLLPRDIGYYERVLAGCTSGGFGCASPTPSVDRLKVPMGVAPSSLGGWGPQTIQSLLFPKVGSNSVAPPPPPSASPLHPSLDTYRQHLVNHFQRQPKGVDTITYAHHVAATVHYYIGIILSAGGAPSTATLHRTPPSKQPNHASEQVSSALQGGNDNSLNGTTSSKCGHLGDTVSGSTSGLTPQELVQKLKLARSEGRKEITIRTRQREDVGDTTVIGVRVNDQELLSNHNHIEEDDLIEIVLRNYGYPTGAVWPTPSAISLSTAGVTGGKPNDTFSALIPNAKEHTRVLKILLDEGDHLSVLDADFSIITNRHSPTLVEASKQAVVLQLHHEYRLLLARCLFTLLLGDGTGPSVVVTPGREVGQATCPDGPPQYNVSYSYQYGADRVGEHMEFPIVCRKEATYNNTYDKHRNALFDHVFGPSSVALSCGGSSKETGPASTEEDMRYVDKVLPSLLKAMATEDNGPQYQDWWRQYYDLIELCTGRALLEYQSDTIVMKPTDFTVMDEQSLVDDGYVAPTSHLVQGRISETDWLLARPPLVQVLLGISSKRNAAPIAPIQQPMESLSRSPSESSSNTMIAPQVSDAKESSSSVELDSAVVADQRYFPTSLFGRLPMGGGAPSQPPHPSSGVLHDVQLTPCTSSVGVLRQDATYEVLGGGRLRLVDINHAPLPNAVVDINRSLPVSLGATSLMHFTLNNGSSRRVRYWMPPTLPSPIPATQSRRRWGPSSIKSLIAALDADHNEDIQHVKHPTTRSLFDEALVEAIHGGQGNRVATFDAQYQQ